jgi:hypothetical protein
LAPSHCIEGPDGLRVAKVIDVKSSTPEQHRRGNQKLPLRELAGRVTASLWIAPYCDPPKQASSAENAWLITFAGLRRSRTQSTSRCRALAVRVDDPVLTAWFSRTRTRHCLGVCNLLATTAYPAVPAFTDSYAGCCGCGSNCCRVSRPHIHFSLVGAGARACVILRPGLSCPVG